MNLKHFMKHLPTKPIAAFMMVLFLTLSSIAPVSAAQATEGYVSDVPNKIQMNLIARYDVDVADPEGGLEIVTYNSANQTAYAVDGTNSVLIAVPFSAITGTSFVDLSSKGYQIDLAKAAEASNTGFSYGDITSVALSPDKTKLAVALQEADYADAGLVAIFPIDTSEDTLGTPVYYTVGVQPDMVTFVDNNKVLSADEGEPRMGYGVNSAGVTTVDPMGSVSVIDLTTSTVTIADFTSFDASRSDLIAEGVLMTRGQAPSVDLEPEYIVVSADDTTAYIALQENNAIAVLDVATATITDVYPLGFKDYSVPSNKIYLDNSAKNYDNLLGAYMPDGISIYEVDGKTYILTANEGDGREWSSTVFPEDHEDAGDPNSDDTSYFSNETKITLNEGTDDEVKKVVVIDPEVTDGLPADAEVLFGGRSFTMFEVTTDGLSLTYDSGSEFEDITSDLYPEWFNTSNTKVKLGDRSTKKGPEPENVVVGTVDGHTYAYVVLERIGGVMAYDITDPTDIFYSNYINTRDFAAEDGIGGDSAPEGIAFIAAADSVTGQAMLITGNEVTGTMPVIALSVAPGDLTGKLVILHTNDTHGSDVAVDGESIGTAGVAQLVKDYEAAGAQVLLISAGDTIQGAPLVNLSKGVTAIDFMNLAQYDMMVPGNHEFDYEYEQLLTLKDQADFPMISANILDKATGDAAFDENIIFDTVVGKVGVFGLTTPETLTKANPENVASLAFPEGEAMYEIAQAQVDELMAAGCDFIVCVAHLGIDAGSEPNTSTDVIANVTGIDLVIDGHSHSEIDGDETATTILASSGSNLENVGVVIMSDDAIDASFLISASDYNDVDPTIDAAIDAKNAQVDEQLSAKFAVTEVILDGNRAPGVRTQETNLGDFASDAVLWAANKAVGEGTVDVAISNGGGIRATVAIGDITMKDMKTVFPFGNTISTLELTGAQLLEILEAATQSAPESLGAFPQVAGVTFTLNTSVPYAKGEQYPDSTYYAPANPGSRITDVMVGDEALDLTATYTISTNNFLAAGGDTYAIFKEVTSFNTYVALEDALVNYTTEVLGGVVSEATYGQPQGRINIISEEVSSVASGETHTVVEGDNLWNLARTYLGIGDRYTEIYDLNKGDITDPDMIHIGQILLIPAK